MQKKQSCRKRSAVLRTQRERAGSHVGSLVGERARGSVIKVDSVHSFSPKQLKGPLSSWCAVCGGHIQKHQGYERQDVPCSPIHVI